MLQLREQEMDQDCATVTLGGAMCLAGCCQQGGRLGRLYLFAFFFVKDNASHQLVQVEGR